jgi:predicted Zn-dependent protease
VSGATKGRTRHPGRGRQASAAGGLLLVLCACDVSLSEENELGDRYAASVIHQVRMLEDPGAADLVRRIGDRLAAVADSAGRDWHFYVVDDTLVNAFAVPGGHIFVFRGLIERAGSHAELAGVVGHEIAHVTRRHSVEQMKSRQKANILVTLFCSIAGICGSTAAQVAIGVGGELLFARYSRADEAEADSVGIGYLARAGMDPRGVPAMFRALLELRQREPSVLDAWLGSHPLEEERIARTERLAAGFDLHQLTPFTRDEQSFVEVRSRLRSGRR